MGLTPEKETPMIPILRPFLILCVLFFMSKSSMAQEEAFLDAYYQCTVEAHSEKGVDLKARVEQLESSLLEKGILSNTQAKAYFKLAEELAKPEAFPWDRTEIDMAGLDSLDGPIPDSCYQKKEKAYDLEGSKIKRIEQRLRKQKKEGDHAFPHAIIAKTLISVLGPKAFEHPAYRMMVLALIFDTPV